MPDDHPKSCDVDPFVDPLSEESGVTDAVVFPTRRWRSAWQIPVLLLSVVGILSALWYRSAEFGGQSPQTLLEHARRHLEAKELQASAAFLVELEPYLDEPDIQDDLVAQFHVTIGDWHVASVDDLLQATPEQGAAIIEAYATASRHGCNTGEQRRLHLAEAMIVSDQHSKAYLTLQPLSGSAEEAIAHRARSLERMLLKQRIIDERNAGMEFAGLLVLVDEFMAHDPDPSQEGWITEVHASILLENTHHGGLVQQMVLDMRRLEAIDDGTIDWPALHVLLGKVYRATGRPGPAADRFDFALNELAATGRARGEALRFMGEMHLDDGDVSRAEARFRAGMDTPGITEDSYQSCELGLARSLSRRGRHEEASEVFARSLRRSNFADSTYAPRIATSLRDEGLAAILAAGDKSHTVALRLLEAAIRYGELAADAALAPDSRRDALRLQGVANETYARTILAPVLGGLDPRDAPLESVPLVMRVKANRHFVAAGEAYLLLDEIVEAHSKEADGRLVWDAATVLDMGGRPNRAVTLYERYLNDRSSEDDRRPEALYRLALAFHAVLNIPQASHWYRMLIDEVDERDPDTAQSSFATRAKVGLARCLASGKDVSEEALLEAELHLRDIVEGRGSVGPDAPEYREAMFQLGRVLFTLQRWPDTIEVLDAALKRYEGDPRAPEFAARNGLAWQALAEDAQEQLLATPLSTSRQVAINQARQDALRSAVDGFEMAISGLDVGGEVQLDPLQMQLLRASYLRRADSIAELGDYEAAMTHYRDVERRFGEDVTAIEALVRMSNLALEFGDFKAARTATSRATVKLRRLDRRVLRGPALMDGVASDALEKWIALQPPGGREGGLE